MIEEKFADILMPSVNQKSSTPRINQNVSSSVNKQQLNNFQIINSDEDDENDDLVDITDNISLQKGKFKRTYSKTNDLGDLSESLPPSSKCVFLLKFFF